MEVVPQYASLKIDPCKIGIQVCPMTNSIRITRGAQKLEGGFSSRDIDILAATSFFGWCECFRKGRSLCVVLACVPNLK